MLLSITLLLCCSAPAAAWQVAPAHAPEASRESVEPAAGGQDGIESGPLAELPGEPIAFADAPPALADDHGTRAGVRLAHAAVDPSGRAALLFAEPRAFAVSLRDRDGVFGALARVPTAAPLAMGSFWGPRVALVPGGVLVVGVLAEHPGRDGDVFVWRSDDDGASFSDPVRLNALEGVAQEALVELAVGPEGRLAVAWMHTEDDVVSLHGAESHDAGAHWSDDRNFASSPEGSLCPCCPPALAYAPDGSALWLLYRDDRDGYRDMQLVELQRPGAPPAPALQLGEERWELGGCPMSVPLLRVGGDGPQVVYRRREALFLGRPANEPGEPLSLSEEHWADGRWPLRARLTPEAEHSGAAPAGSDSALLFWRAERRLRARVPGDFLDRDLGPARRVLLAESLDPDGPLLLAAELDDQAGGWHLALRLLRDRAP